MRPAVLTRNGGVATGSPPVRPTARIPILTPRLVGLLVLAGAVTGFLAYMVESVPVDAQTLDPGEAHRHWAVAATAALIVLGGVLLVVTETLKIRRLESRSAGSATAVAHQQPSALAARPRVPHSLRWERVPTRAVAIAGSISLTGLAAAVVLGAPLWIGGLAVLLPWIPLLAIEAKWKYARYGVFAGFAMLVLLQILHMGEHTMQVGQLAFSQGELARSHGVFGQLDFELVHFVTDTMLWFSLGMLLIVFRGRNRWLWVAFAAASLHQIEHFYLFWIYNTDGSFYAHGGFAGIMGSGGMIGSPLDRPYLHFTYNLIVIVPMAIAVWDEARRVDDRG